MAKIGNNDILQADTLVIRLANLNDGKNGCSNVTSHSFS